MDGVVSLISMGCIPPSSPKLGDGDSGASQGIFPRGTDGWGIINFHLPVMP